MSLSLVVTVILNTNRRQDTIECLASLKKSTYSNNKIIVLDNHSIDGSQQAIEKMYPDVQIISLKENLGYAGNNNVGISLAIEQGADWVFVLNEDTIVKPDCIGNLIEVGESNPKIGILGPMVFHHNEPDVIQSAGGVLGPHWESIHLGQNELNRGQYVDPHFVEWVSGCAIMVRRSVIEQVGMLDPNFFYYWEETDWCLRVRAAGWQIVHVPIAILWHKGVQRDYNPPPNVTYYNTRNRLLILSKHNAPARVWMIAWFEILRTLTSWSVRSKWRSKREHRNAMWQGILDFIFHRWGPIKS
jgi:GT2 family glycosyltransferase